MQFRAIVRIGPLLVSTAMLAVFASGIASAQGRGHQAHKKARGRTLYVSPSGTSGAADRSCRSAGYSTVQSAVNAARAGSRVVVCRGTYTEDVVISKRLTLTGSRGAVIHGSPSTSSECTFIGAKGPETADCLAAITIKSSRVTVQGLKVTGAIGEGILATGSLTGGSISHVVIRHNHVVRNDRGGIPPTKSSPYPQCVEVGQVPGDCGEGIHLMGVAHSVVYHNYIRGNTGGVLLTDEFGPTHRNVISRNTITKNKYDCGITVPGHNPKALDSSGNPQPSKGGVYRNVIRYNRITFNGLKGEGAGVLFANAAAGTAAYDNRVARNVIFGNSLSGVTLHAHTIKTGEFEDLSGNVIVNNRIGKNNLGGDAPDGPTGPKDTRTTGILIYSGSVPVTVRIFRNRIRNNYYGIWSGVGGNVTVSQAHNLFRRVHMPLFTQS